MSDFEPFMKLLSEFVKQNKKSSEHTKVPFTDPFDFILNGWFKDRNYTICDKKFQIVDKYGQTVGDIKCELTAYVAENKDRPKYLKALSVNKRDILELVSYLKIKTRKEIWDKTRDIFVNSENYDEGLACTEIQKIVDVILKKSNDPAYELESQRYWFIFFNFFQQLKHQAVLNELHPFPIIPVLYGKEGTGKTNFVKILAAPLEPFVAKVGLNVFTESEKYFKIQRDNRLLICEELVGADKADQASLKSNTTSKDNVIRPMFTQDHEVHLINSVTIANSNYPTWECMNSFDKNRRWGNVFIRDDIDLKALKDIRIDIILKTIPLCISESEINRSKKLYTSYLEPYQLETQNQDAFEEWAKHKNLSISENWSDNSFVSFDDFWKDFCWYWTKRRMPIPKKYTPKFLKNKIKVYLGIDSISETDKFDYVDGKKARGLKVSTVQCEYNILETADTIPFTSYKHA